MSMEEVHRCVAIAAELLRMVQRAKWDSEDASLHFTFAATVNVRLRALTSNLETA